MTETNTTRRKAIFSTVATLAVAGVWIWLMLSTAGPALVDTAAAQSTGITFEDNYSAESNIEAVGTSGGDVFFGLSNGNVTKVDNESMSEKSRVELSSRVNAIAVKEDTIWAASGRELAKIDAATMTKVNNITLSNTISSVDLSGNLYVGIESDCKIYEIDGSGLGILNSGNPCSKDGGSGSITAVSATDDHVFVGAIDDSITDTTYHMWKLDADTFGIVAGSGTPSSVVQDVEYNSGYVYGAVASNDRVYKFYDNNLSSKDSWLEPNGLAPLSLEIVEGFVYVGSVSNDIYQLEVGTLSQEDTYSGHGDDVDDLNFGEAYLYSASSDGEGHKLDVPSQHVITGEIIDSKTGESIPGATVTVTNTTSGNVVKSTIADPTGSYYLEVVSGEYNITANHPDYVAETKTNVLVDQDMRLDFFLDPDKEGLITGKIINNKTGEAISGAEITVRENSTQQINGTDLSDSNGQYSIPVENGTYDVTATGDGYSEESVLNVTVAGDEKQVNLRLDPHPFLSGKVTDAENKSAIEGATIQVFSQSGQELHKVTTDEFGEYEINISSSGEYTVHASGEGYVNSTRTNVTIDRPVEEDFELVQKVEKIELEVRPHLEWNESTEYEVFLTTTTDQGVQETFDISDNSNLTITSDDPGNLTVFPSNNTVKAGHGYNVTANLTAEYTTEGGDQLNDTEEVVVAVESIDNVDILPVITSIAVIISDTTVQTILIATGIGVAATLIATSFAGIGAFMLAFFAAWLGGWLVTPIFGVGILMAGFVGLNVAQNVDYMRSR